MPDDATRGSVYEPGHVPDFSQLGVELRRGHAAGGSVAVRGAGTGDRSPATQRD